MQRLTRLWLRAATIMTAVLATQPIPKNPPAERVAVRRAVRDQFPWADRQLIDSHGRIVSEFEPPPKLVSNASPSSKGAGRPALVKRPPVARQAVTALLESLKGDLPRATGLSRYGAFAGGAAAWLPMAQGPNVPLYRFHVSPAEEVRFALADARTQPNPATLRYLTLGHLTPEQADKAIVAVNLALQSTSRVRAITPCVRISETVLRVDGSAYVNGPKEFEEWSNGFAQLCATDFYHHLQTQAILPGQSKPSTVIVSHGFLDLQAESQLRTLTNSPNFGAMLRADYFAANALRPPVYYQMAGIPKTKAEFLKLFGVDQAAVERLEADAGANLHNSGVTKKTRRIIWTQTLLGGLYYTLDSKIGDAVHNPFYRPISAEGSQLQFDAEEHFALNRNGFWLTAIFDNKGNRLDTVDPVIASDYEAATDGAADTQVRAGFSCLRCHSTSGLNSFSDDQTKLLQTKRGTATLSSYDGSYVRRVLGFYDESRLQRQMEFDRQTNSVAVMRACGCTPAIAVADLAATVKWSEYDPVTPEMVATELCTTADQLPQLIGSTKDPNLAGILERHVITRDAWKSCYAEAAAKRWARN
jgi:hypothetical protein